MPRLTSHSKLKAVKSVVDAKKRIKDVCREYQCSRQSLTSWIKNYKKSPQKGNRSLVSHYRRGRKHHKSLSWKVERLILDSVVKNPDYSVRQILGEVRNSGIKVSLHGIYGILVRYNLQTKELRHRFSLDHPIKTVFASSIPSLSRSQIIEKYLEKGESVSVICRRFHIARPTFYSWLKLYKEVAQIEGHTQTDLVEAVSKKYRRGESHHRSISADVREAILDVVKHKPSLSVHQIYAQVPQVAGKPIVGHHGIQNLLSREGLNTMASRIKFAEGFAPEPTTAISPLYKPEIPVYRLRWIIAPFLGIPKLLLTKPRSGIVATLSIFLPLTIIFLWLRSIAGAADGTSTIGLIFASIALFFGIFFFIYSMKYYVTILLVLKLAQSGGEVTKSTEGAKGTKGQRFLEILSKLGIRIPERKGINPLLVNLDKVEVTERPFVSIHVASYNEKRVIERLIAACTRQEWYVSANSSTPGVKESYTPGVSLDGNPERSRRANYEVVIVDDSTDETTEIAKQSLGSAGWQLSEISHPGVATTTIGSAGVGDSIASTYAKATVDKSLQNDNEEEIFIFKKPMVQLLSLYTVSHELDSRAEPFSKP